MIYLLVVALCVALFLALRLLWRQNRSIAELRESIRAGRPMLHEEEEGPELPQWHGLTGAVNALITENVALRQRSSDQLAQLEATLGNLREAVLIVDGVNTVHLANRALREIFPKARDVVNVRLEIIVRSAAFLEYVRATRAGQILPRQEFEIVGTGRSTWIEVSGAAIPSPDGKAQWALFVIHDMTQQRVLETTRKEFVANASHELRTPLAVIKGYVETLVDGHATMDPADRERFLRTILRHSDRLVKIIADLLTLSRLESATPGVNFETIELGRFLEALVADAAQQPAAAQHELNLRIAGELGFVRGDSEKLTQVVSNLLENAFKYSPPGSRVEVSARLLPRNAATGNNAGATSAAETKTAPAPSAAIAAGAPVPAVSSADEIEIAVRDNGPGIPEEDLPHIFERFYRVEKGRARESGGTGLGLSIVKHVAQLHGGRVWAESAAGKGTAIVVRLPRGETKPVRP